MLNDTTFNLASVGDVQSLIEVIQSSYVKQIGVKHKRVIHIPAVNDLEIAALHPSDPDTLIKLGRKSRRIHFTLYANKYSESSSCTANREDTETDVCALSAACQSTE